MLTIQSFLIVESNGRQAVSRKHERQPAPQRSFDADVAIIGAGPVGLMLGALLARRNIRTVIYERRQAPYSAPRAIAFDPETLRTFQAIDRYEALEHSLLLDVPVAYFSGGGDLLARITNTDERLGFSPRGTFYQPELEAAISDAIPQWPALSLQRGVEVSDVCDHGNRVELHLRRDDGSRGQVCARYVVACDGGASRTRERLGIRFAGSTFAEKWLVVDVEGDDYPDREIRFFCDPRRPVVTLPVSKGRRRWEFLLQRHARPILQSLAAPRSSLARRPVDDGRLRCYRAAAPSARTLGSQGSARRCTSRRSPAPPCPASVPASRREQGAVYRSDSTKPFLARPLARDLATTQRRPKRVA